MTDGGGAFQLIGLPSGAGELVLGAPASPLQEPLTIELAPGWVDLGTLALPPLGSLVIRVVDEAGWPVEGAVLSGVGDRGGSLAAVSDADGAARAELLPRGMYRVFAQHPELGRGNQVLELDPDTASETTIVLRLTAPPD
jgi:hypothetical protein